MKSYARTSALSPRSSRWTTPRSEEHTSELQSQSNLVCRLLLEKKNRRRRADKSKSQIHRIVICPDPHICRLPDGEAGEAKDLQCRYWRGEKGCCGISARLAQYGT